MNCLFCKIINKKVPSDIVYEDEKAIAFKDIHPKAPVHLLILPKKHIPSVNHLEKKRQRIDGRINTRSSENRKRKKLKGYKLIINVGREGGQVIEHLHLHLLSGKPIQLP